jgi:hypothetical protein
MGYMNKLSGRIKQFSILGILVWVLAFSAVQVHGQSSSSNSFGDSYRVSPLRTEITVSQGQSTKVPVYIQNLTPSRVTLRVIRNDFVASDKEDGVPNIILDDTKFAPYHSLKKFMLTPDTITLGPNERGLVNVNVAVPSSAQSGGYYGAIRFAPNGSTNTKNIGVQGSVTSLIILTVPGNLIENLTLKSFDVTQHGKPVSRLGSRDDVSTILRLENKGNIQLAPFGDVFVQKGKKVLYSAKVNDTNPKNLILPGSVRRWDLPLQKLGNFGKYKVSAVVGYGGSGQTITVEKTIWIIPSTVIFGILFAIALLAVLIFLVVRALHSYKKRILRNARRGRY